MAKRPRKRLKRFAKPITRGFKASLQGFNWFKSQSSRVKRSRRFPRKKKGIDYDARYSSDWHSGKVQAFVHAATLHRCCWCHKRRSTEVHHAAYADDDGRVRDDEFSRAGTLLFPVCDECHIPVLHSNQYWIVDSDDPLWGNRNTLEALERLQVGYEILSKGIYR